MKIRFNSWPGDDTAYLTAIGGSGTAESSYPVSSIHGFVHEIEASGLTGLWYLGVGDPSGITNSYEVLNINGAETIIDRSNPNSITDEILDVVNVIQSGGGATGAGAIKEVITISDGSNPIEDVEIWITDDIEGINIIAGTSYTNANGQATFFLDPGTYYVWSHKNGYNFTNPSTITVS